MLWRRRKPSWLVDPSRVTFGSVVDSKGRNLSRSHVRVKYRADSEERFVPLADFIRSCHGLTRNGRALDIDRLIVAPIVKQRYATFFDGLTDWAPAQLRARKPPSARRPPASPGRERRLREPSPPGVG